ncbi:photosystem II reaction center protein PsbM [Dapis sp. BLCC M229]|uniref:photosystem II reaction center protein PsbM n=1 Tax=Dapis sp. BLCC M229 TaxID=3400188 RepID=UPI003CEAC42A
MVLWLSKQNQNANNDILVLWYLNSRWVIMEVNNLGFVATILFIFVPAVFLIILYIQTGNNES